MGTKAKLKYQRVKDLVVKSILDGEIADQECLPSERELCQRYHASRVTIRKAVDELEQEGVLYRIQGKGTFLKHQQKVTQPLTRLTGFTEDMHAQGKVAGSRILLMDRTAANAMLAEKLHLQPGEEIIVFRRLRLADGEPMAIETTYLDYQRFSPMLEEFTAGESFYAFMRNRLGIVPKHALQSMEVAPLASWEAELLGNGKLDVAMLMYRQTFDQDERPIEYVISKYRSDKYKFKIDLYTL